jgi:uncharacterized protein YodC (DUF2158 family)
VVDQIRSGSIVRLRSGGPAMTVEAIILRADGTLGVRCAWSNDTKRISQIFELDDVLPVLSVI